VSGPGYKRDVPIIVASTASPYKFSQDVLKGLGIAVDGDEFDAVRILSSTGAGAVHRAVDGLNKKRVLHDRVIDVAGMRDEVRWF
jgi:threonine synthase